LKPISAILQEDRSQWFLCTIDGRRYRVAPGEPLQWCVEGTLLLFSIPEELQTSIRRAREFGGSLIRNTGPAKKSTALSVTGLLPVQAGLFPATGGNMQQKKMGVGNGK
jgi:hypothetical protein